MKGWLDKYDDAIVAQGGETIPFSREDYLRLQYQAYLKEQAEKGRKAVVEGREKFAKDYVIPAIKTAASFTPAGPLIGLADAYEAYQQGNTGWALAGAGMEALPYVGKGVGKGIKALSNIVTDNKNAIKLAYYNKAPWTWKPNESAYYHRSPEITNIVNKETKTLQGFGASEAGKKYSEMATPGLHGINLVKPANNTLHYSKGVPLDWGRYNLSGQGYAGPYMLEVENVPMRATTQGRVKSFAPTKKEAYASSERPVSLDEVNFYKEHPIFGYKKIKPQFQTGGMIPKAQEGRILEREGMKESPFSFLIPEKSGSGTGRTSKYFTELSNYYKGDASYPYQYLYESEYKPTMGLGEDVQYMSIQDEPFKQRIVEEFNKGKKKGNKVNVSYAKDLDPLGKFSIYEGKDEGGEYLSYYDKWDVNPLADMIGKPFELYDRIYIDQDSTGRYIPREEFKNGGQLKKSNQLRTFTNGWLDKYL